MKNSPVAFCRPAVFRLPSKCWRGVRRNPFVGVQKPSIGHPMDTLTENAFLTSHSKYVVLYLSANSKTIHTLALKRHLYKGTGAN
jgi:hypothetical protein